MWGYALRVATDKMVLTFEPVEQRDGRQNPFNTANSIPALQYKINVS
jgi:hypothetical protein